VHRFANTVTHVTGSGTRLCSPQDWKPRPLGMVMGCGFAASDQEKESVVSSQNPEGENFSPSNSSEEEEMTIRSNCDERVSCQSKFILTTGS
jgi:hypothetical protein